MHSEIGPRQDVTRGWANEHDGSAREVDHVASGEVRDAQADGRRGEEVPE